MDQNIGKMLDNRYEILELVGVGGMAKVYKARCHRLNRLVAVKILRDDLSQDSDFRRRFHDESQAVAMLSHPNIVAVYDVSRSSDLEYIVMELIEGITLKQYMQKKGNKLNFEINYKCRLIDTDEYLVTDGQSLFGFIAGILASNHDVTDIFVDSALKICQNDAESFDAFLNNLETLIKNNDVNCVITSSVAVEEASDTVKKFIA